MPEFARPRHRLVWKVLESLDSELLESTHCYFAGGTRIVLELGEYRDSLDVDFLCADRAGYRTLRGMITQRSFGGMFREEFELMRDVRADMYGFRTYLRVDGEPVKFEVISEGRIDIEGAPSAEFPVPLLSKSSCFAEKFLANTDRGRDVSSRSRDLIDLSFMCSKWPTQDLRCGLTKAVEAYGDSVQRELDASLIRFDDRQYRALCTTDLAVSDARVLTRGLLVLRAEAARFFN